MSLWKSIITIGTVIIIVTLVCSTCNVPPGYFGRQHMNPLNDAVIRDLCEKFELSPENELCEASNTLYTIDFFPIIYRFFTQGEDTYDDVQEKLGRYQIRCGATWTTADGESYYSCRYSLTGSEVDQFGIRFSGDHKLERIFSPID